MSIGMKTEFMGYGIRLIQSWQGEFMGFEISMDGTVLKNNFQKLTDCEEWIKAQIKKKFKRVPVIRLSENHKDRKIYIEEGECTSICEDGECWVVFGNMRNKRQCKSIAIDNPENRRILETAIEIENQIAELRNDVKNLIETLVRISPEMLHVKE